jgi:predicted metal-dependent hydrolase
MAAVQIVFDFFRGARSRALPDAEAEEARGARRLEQRLGELLGAVVLLTLTDNGRTMVSARERQGVVHVRLHSMFASADDATLRAIASFLVDGHGKASAQLQRYIDHHRAQIRRRAISAARTTESPTRGVRTRSSAAGTGKHHDLQAMFERINAAYFDGSVDAHIDWARMSRGHGRRRRRHSIKLGSYRGSGAQIRVHPILDADWVPPFFVEYIVYHEMLHHVIPMPVHNGKRRLHGPEFKSRERMFPRYAEALAWERANLDRLLSS